VVTIKKYCHESTPKSEEEVISSRIHCRTCIVWKYPAVSNLFRCEYRAALVGYGAHFHFTSWQDNSGSWTALSSPPRKYSTSDLAHAISDLHHGLQGADRVVTDTEVLKTYGSRERTRSTSRRGCLAPEHRRFRNDCEHRKEVECTNCTLWEWDEPRRTYWWST
jgi:hypothetical protein